MTNGNGDSGSRLASHICPDGTSFGTPSSQPAQEPSTHHTHHTTTTSTYFYTVGEMPHMCMQARHSPTHFVNCCACGGYLERFCLGHAERLGIAGNKEAVLRARPPRGGGADGTAHRVREEWGEYTAVRLVCIHQEDKGRGGGGGCEGKARLPLIPNHHASLYLTSWGKRRSP